MHLHKKAHGWLWCLRNILHRIIIWSSHPWFPIWWAVSWSLILAGSHWQSNTPIKSLSCSRDMIEKKILVAMFKKTIELIFKSSLSSSWIVHYINYDVMLIFMPIYRAAIWHDSVHCACVRVTHIKMWMQPSSRSVASVTCDVTPPRGGASLAPGTCVPTQANKGAALKRGSPSTWQLI